jgi:hypothetical protein
MKRTLIVVAAACMLAVPTIASGQVARGIYEGHLAGAPESPVKLKFNLAVNGTESSGAVTGFAVHNLAVTCDDGITAVLRHAKLRGNIPIGDGSNFRAQDDNGDTVYKVSGHVGVNKAFGTFRLSGQIRGSDGVTRTCDTGPQGWVAR